MIKQANKLIEWYLNKVDKWGITLPPFGIYIIKEQLYNQDLIKHEKVHWEQYKKYGAIKFYLKYFYYMITVGYDKHPMEKEANEK